ncbi:pectinacetylesterase family protein, partial [Striga asiatica]
CLDGSPAGYHFFEGFGNGASSWLIYLPGGGWCSSKENCQDRALTPIGSTINITTHEFAGILGPNQIMNPDFYNWNKVYVRYCDGSSFIGDVEAIEPGTNLHYRGSRIFSAVIEEILAKGMKNAENIILTGNSAGGLATILNCDRFKAMVPTAARTKCIADSGFFIIAKDLPNADERISHYKDGVAKFLPSYCTSRMATELCFFPENLVGGVQTPLFLLNSAFDYYQIAKTLKPYPGDKPGWASCTNETQTCTPRHFHVIKDFKNAFLKAVEDISDSPSRGLFINSCYIHDFLWANDRWNSDRSPKLENKNVAQAVGNWYFDRSIVKMIDTQSEYPIECHLANDRF